MSGSCCFTYVTSFNLWTVFFFLFFLFGQLVCVLLTPVLGLGPLRPLLGPQVLCVLVQPAAPGTGLLGPRIQGLVPLNPCRISRVWLMTVRPGATGLRTAGISESLEAARLGQVLLQVLQLFKQLVLLTAKVSSLNLGRVPTIWCRRRRRDSLFNA